MELNFSGLKTEPLVLCGNTMTERPELIISHPSCITVLRSSEGLVLPTTIGVEAFIIVPKRGISIRSVFITKLETFLGQIIPGSKKVSKVLI
jgi:hypothetical protein